MFRIVKNKLIQSKDTVWPLWQPKKTIVVRRQNHMLTGSLFLALLVLGSVVYISSHSSVKTMAAPLASVTNTASPIPNELLIKFSPSTRGKINEDKNSTGLPSLDRVFSSRKIVKFSRVAKPGKKSQQNHELFDWYKVTLDPTSVQTIMGHPNAKGVSKVPDNATLNLLKNDLKRDSNVIAVEENYTVSTQAVPNDPYYSSAGSWGQTYGDMWGMKRINPETAWSSNTSSSPVVVADIDSGADINHPDLAANIWTNPGEVPGNGIDDDGNGYVDDVHGWNWVSGNNNVNDDNGHGTHTAGTVGAVGNNGSGVVGVAWSTSIMPLKFLNSGGSGSNTTAAQALQYAADMGARVSSNSWGCGCRSQVIDDAVKYEHDRNMVTIVAAGNSTMDALDFTPASSDGAITVGASDSNDALASFSDFGSRVDVVAPGVDILSLKASSGTICDSTRTVATVYCRLSGTSMATPHVSGLAALFIAKNPSLSNEDIRQALRLNAKDLGAVGRDSSFGYGMIDVSKTISSDPSTLLKAYIATPSSRTNLGTGIITVSGTVGGTNFASYKLEIGAGRAPTAMTLLANGTSVPANDVLGSINPVSLNDGTYTLRLTTTGTDGKTAVYEVYDLVIDNIVTSIIQPASLVPVGQTTIMGTVTPTNGLTLASYALDYGIGSSPTSWSTAGLSPSSGSSTVSEGLLSTWNTSNLVDGQLYTLRLTATLTNGAKDIITITVTADKNLVSGWPMRFTSPVSSCAYMCEGTPAFADLLGDGSKELIVAVPGTNQIFAYRKDGSILPGFPVSVDSGDWFKWPVVAADVTGDGKPEIIAAAITPDNNAQHIYIVSGTGQLLPNWPKPTFQSASSTVYDDNTPSIADLDGDGVKELVMHTFNQATFVHTLHAMHADGTEVAGFPKTIPVQNSFMQYPLTVADLDGDGKPEIAFGDYDKFYLFDNSGNLLPGWPYKAPLLNGQIVTYQSTPSIGDIDGDGQLEVYSVATPNGALGISLPLFGWKKDGSLVTGFPQQTGQYGNYYVGWPLNNTATTDVDGDAKDEVIVGNNNLTIHKQTGIMNITSQVGRGSVTVNDITGDRSIKIFGGRWSSTDALQLFNADGSVLYHKDSTYGHDFIDPIVSADMDNNGRQEFAAIMNVNNTPYTYVYLWEMPSGANGSYPVSEWPMFGQNPAKTNHYTPGVRVVPDTIPPTVSITSPVDGAQVGGTVTVSASASDNRSVAKVEFYTDGVLKSTATTTPYSYSWNTTTYAGGTHSIMAKAYDAAGLTASSTISVTINNADTTPPTVAVTAPVNASQVGGTVSVIATASDNKAVAKVEFYIDGVLKATSIASPYSYNWNTTTVADGQHTVMAKAYDTSNLTATSSVTVTVNNADVTPPTVAITYPTNNGTVPRNTNITITATATDNVQVSKVEFYINGTLACTDTTSPYSCVYKIAAKTGQTYTFMVKAYDAAGNVSSSTVTAKSV